MTCNCRRMIDEPAGHEPTCDYGQPEYWVNLEVVNYQWGVNVEADSEAAAVEKAKERFMDEMPLDENWLVAIQVVAAETGEQ